MIDSFRSDFVFRLKCNLVTPLLAGEGCLVVFTEGPGGLSVPSVRSAREGDSRNEFAGLLLGHTELGEVTGAARPAYIWTDDYETWDHYKVGDPLYVSAYARFKTRESSGGQIARVIVAPCAENPFMLVALD